MINFFLLSEEIVKIDETTDKPKNHQQHVSLLNGQDSVNKIDRNNCKALAATAVSKCKIWELNRSLEEFKALLMPTARKSRVM